MGPKIITSPLNISDFLAFLPHKQHIGIGIHIIIFNILKTSPSSDWGASTHYFYRIFAYTYIYIHIHTYIYICMYIHIHHNTSWYIYFYLPRHLANLSCRINCCCPYRLDFLSSFCILYNAAFSFFRILSGLSQHPRKCETLCFKFFNSTVSPLPQNQYLFGAGGSAKYSCASVLATQGTQPNVSFTHQSQTLPFKECKTYNTQLPQLAASKYVQCVETPVACSLSSAQQGSCAFPSSGQLWAVTVAISQTSSQCLECLELPYEPHWFLRALEKNI